MPDNKRYYISGGATEAQLEAFINQVLDEMEADGHVFPPDDESDAQKNPKPVKREPEPDNYRTWFNRGDDHMNYSEYEPALDCYDKSLAALAENPPGDGESERRSILRMRVRVLSRLNRHEEALRGFDEVMKLARVPLTGQLTLWQAGFVLDKGLALTNAGRSDEGMACYERALVTCRREWEDGSEAGGVNMALTLFNMGEAYRALFEFDSSLEKYNEALALYRLLDAKRGNVALDIASVLCAKSRALSRLHRYDEALTAAEEAVRILEPTRPVFGGESLQLDWSLALLRKGKALAGLHRHAEASSCFQRSTELVHEVKRKRGTLKDTDEAPE